MSSIPHPQQSPIRTLPHDRLDELLDERDALLAKLIGEKVTDERDRLRRTIAELESQIVRESQRK